MPIFLNGGIPGSGKTLRVLWKVERLRRESGRPVFYHRIADLKLQGWEKLENPRLWSDCPDGAIIVIDEAHEVFPKRGPSAQVPEHVNRLATHRHQGFDIFLITQHAMNQLDHFVRGLIDEHEHSVRLFGAERARIHRWPVFQEKPLDYHAKKESVTEIWKFPKEVYGWYKSAEVHTVKKNLPWKMIGAGVLCLVVIGYAGMSAYDTFFNIAGSSASVVATDQSLVAKAVRGPAVSSGALEDPATFIPRVEGVPFTAPFYAEAVAVTTAPQVAGCMQLKIGSAVTCKCASQQGTTIPMEKRMCMDYVRYGNYRFDRGDDYYPKIEPYVPPLAPPMQYSDTGLSDNSGSPRGGRESELGEGVS